ncbi:hypothetical protein [Janthinobacterium lividum]|uniref:hypothetical protein n=1 Tax=Janthinobacterium lividum TaxID=29581 RepID=UPI001595C9D1|nr:hypothetical protein [Janthinobacterium lividum]QKY08780.1 hypothetical protein G8765_14150 [Janthinobacterium lividum]
MIALMLAIPGATGFDVTEVIVRPATPKLRLVGGTDMAKSELEDQIAQIEARRAAVELGQTEFTVVQFCKQRGLELSMRDMQRLGKATAKFSREAGLQISRAADELFGEVNAYCTQALEAVMGKFAAAAEVAA